MSLGFASQEAVAQAPFGGELLVRPEVQLRSAGGLSPQDGVPGLGVEVGVTTDRGTIFGYALRLRAAHHGDRAELSGLLEARVTVGLEGDVGVPRPVLRGGLRFGHTTSGAEGRYLLGPHLSVGLAMGLGAGVKVELGAAGYAEILPFALSLGLQLVVRVPWLSPLME